MLAAVLVRLRSLLARRRTDDELNEEIRYHLAREIERNVAAGMSADDAREAARRAFGNVTVTTEAARDAWRWTWLEELKQDIAYALRAYRRAPSFVITVVATIGLGLGLLSTVFTVFDAYALRPVAVRDPQSLYDLSWHSRDGMWHTLTWPQYRAICSRRDVFTECLAHAHLQARIRARPMIGQLVSGSYFEMLGASPALGRLLRPDDAESPGTNAVIVLSHDTWQSAFGADSSIIGEFVPIDGVRYRIVGVARAGFSGLESVPLQFWIPITMSGSLETSPDFFATPPTAGIRLVGRLRHGITPDVASAVLASRLGATVLDSPPPRRLNDVVLESRATPLAITPEALAAVTPILLAFVLVMLIACANVANMMLARGMARQREIGIRLALGAGRTRLIRQLLTESVLLSIPSAAAGYLVSRLTIALGVIVMFTSVPPSYRAYVRPMPLSPDLRVVLFVMCAAVGSAVVFGLVPAIQATRPSVVHATRGDFDSNLRPSRMRGGLLLVQITMSVLLLITAGILLRVARETDRLLPGIRTSNLVEIRVITRGQQKAIEQLGAMPGVLRLATATKAPLDGIFNDVEAGGTPSSLERIKFNIVSPGYFPALDLPILRGRNFTIEEAEARAPIVIVSEATAAHLWPGADPIGRQIFLGRNAVGRVLPSTSRAATVIGVVPNVAAGWIGLSHDLPVAYYPIPLDAAIGSSIIVRVAGDAETAREAIDGMLSQSDSISVSQIRTIDASLAIQRWPFHVGYWVASLIGGLALLLTITGVYGVLSYVVAQRTREFGVRIALGASPAGLVGLVVRQLVKLALFASLIGVVLATGASRLLQSALEVFDAYDPGGYAIGLVVVLGSCAVAAYVPARRAAKADPVVALRSD
ncbi:MAG TPA: ADOP family duplicated permease [Gemmatimonadaceae bacterium]|nr:ADOP family duplicated permease [Gemmatimonadaceae bacterium]